MSHYGKKILLKKKVGDEFQKKKQYKEVSNCNLGYRGAHLNTI